MSMKVPDILKTISEKLLSKNAKAILVGGCVRDHFLEIEAKDYDIEVYGLDSIEEFEELLSEFGRVELVGKSFGVLKFIYEKEVYDFAFPRVERKVAKGHKGFDVDIDGFLSFKDAAKRRDFTINSMGYDLSQDKFLDPFKGRDDLDKKVLRHIDDKSFIEDPLRVYRGIGFCARFNLTMCDETKKLCSYMVEEGMLEELPKERVYEEFKKLLLKADKPSIGFELLRELGVLRYFPQLLDLIGLKQEPKWHPEGDVWTHTMMVIDEAVKLRNGNERDDLVLMFGALCHDFGKATTTEFIDGRIRSRGHEREGVLPTEEFISSLSDDVDLLKRVTPLVANHLAPFTLHKDNSSNKAIRRLSTKVKISDLVKVAQADFYGRAGVSEKFEAGEWLLKKAKELQVEDSKPKMILQGRDLIKLGLKPSPKFKEILDEVYERQLDGDISSLDEAISLLKKEYI